MMFGTLNGIGANDQIVPTQYVPGGGSDQCNTAGGYSYVHPLGWSYGVCMTPAQLAATNAQYNANASAPPSSSSGGSSTPPPSTPPATTPPPTSAPPSSSAMPAATTPLMIGSFDPTAFIKANWVLLAAGAALILIVKS